MPSQASPLLHISKPAVAIGLDRHYSAHTLLVGHGPPLPTASRRLRGRDATAPISKARHVPDTAPINPRLASASKIYILERLISVYHAERYRNAAIGASQQGGRMVVFSVLCCNFLRLGGLRERSLPPRRVGRAFLRDRLRAQFHAWRLISSGIKV